MSVTKGTIIDLKYVIFLFEKPCGAEIYQAAQQHRVCMDADGASAAFGEVFGFLCGGTLEDDAM